MYILHRTVYCQISRLFEVIINGNGLVVRDPKNEDRSFASILLW